MMTLLRYLRAWFRRKRRQINEPVIDMIEIVFNEHPKWRCAPLAKRVWDKFKY